MFNDTSFSDTGILQTRKQCKVAGFVKIQENEYENVRHYEDIFEQVRYKDFLFKTIFKTYFSNVVINTLLYPG